MNRFLPAVAALSLGAVFLLQSSCSSYPRRDPTGERFPTVRGKALDGRGVTLPDDFAGAPLLLLVGYEQNTQFDLDRWLLSLHQSGMQVRAFEVPTIPGLVPGMFAGSIDSGMRRGIPQEDWGAVVTVYGDADAIAQFTGNADGLPGRILLLDGAGKVVFFHDRGYSVGTLEQLRAALAGAR
jgi:hypothetical protein